MNRPVVFKKFLIPAFSAAAIKNAGEDDDNKMRPSELPIYGEVCEVCKPDPCAESSTLECQIGALRKELWVWHDKLKETRKEVLAVCETGVAHTATALEYLKDESNYLPRYGAIGISGVAGVVCGLRGGVIRRLTYGTAAALGMASLCYPREAGEVSREAVAYTKKYARVGYNFVYGVKPDYLSLPDPSTFMKDEGADVKKPPSSVTKPSLFDSLKSSFLDVTNLSSKPAPVVGSGDVSNLVATRPPVEAVKEDDVEEVEVARTTRDQSSPSDKPLYPTRK